MQSTIRRAAVGRTALSILAGVFLAASLVFWGVLHWTVFVTPGAGIPQIAVALVMTVIYAFALPLLLSMLVPTTPAGQMLQKTQWKTVGFPVIIASAAFLAWHARNLMVLWFAAQPAIAEAQQDAAYTLAALIGFVVIPALAWVQVTPERWLREIEQAHLVKKLEVEQQGELAIVKARLLWAEQKAAISYARLLPMEQKEVRTTLRGLLMGIADTQRSIARTMGIQADVERTILGDKDIADALDYVEQQLEKPAQLIERNLTYFDEQERETDVQPTQAPTCAHVGTRLQSSESRETSGGARRHTTTYDDAYLHASRQHFGAVPWTIKQLAAALNLGETSTKELRDEWIAHGLAIETRIGRWCFKLTEDEGA